MEIRPIAFFIPGLNGGGAQKVVVNLANALIDIVERPIHIVLVRAEGEFLEEVKPEVEIIDLGKRRTSRSIFALASYLRRTRPEVLCSSLNYANICATIAWWLAGRPCRLVLREDSVVRLPQGKPAMWVRMFIRQRLMSLLYPSADAVVAISDEVSRTLQQQGICRAEKVKILGNPVSIGSENTRSRGKGCILLPPGSKYLCAMGRLTQAKGFDVLLDAFARLADPEKHLVILGEGTLRSSLERQAKQLGIASRVHMPGFISPPYDILSKAEVFVLSSRWEGFGNVLVEALATGVPVVSTDCPGGPRWILADGKYGRLVPVDDAVALTEAIKKTLSDPVSGPGERRTRAQYFSPSRIAEDYLKSVLLPRQ